MKSFQQAFELSVAEVMCLQSWWETVPLSFFLWQLHVHNHWPFKLYI